MLTWLIVTIGIIILFTFLIQYKFRKIPIYIVPFIVSIVINLSLQLINYIQIGHLDPFFLIALGFGLLWAFGISFVVAFFIALALGRHNIQPNQAIKQMREPSNVE